MVLIGYYQHSIHKRKKYYQHCTFECAIQMVDPTIQHLLSTAVYGRFDCLCPRVGPMVLIRMSLVFHVLCLCRAFG